MQEDPRHTSRGSEGLHYKPEKEVTLVKETPTPGRVLPVGEVTNAQLLWHSLQAFRLLHDLTVREIRNECDRFEDDVRDDQLLQA